MEFCGKNAVVIGGCGGIGAEICREFLKRKVLNLAILDKTENEEFVKKLVVEYPESKIIFIVLDISSKANIDAAFEKIIQQFKFIDFLTNCAGICDETKPESVIAINLTGVILTTLKGIDCMSKDKGGRGGFIANIASTLGLEPAPTHSVYCASKHGVVGFSRSISSLIYYEHTGININTICPGKTETSLLENFLNVTLEYGKSHSCKLMNTKGQTTSECAACIMDALEQNKIGAVWMVDQAVLTEVQFPTYWIPEPL